MKAISSMATRHLLAELAAAAVAGGLPDVDIESVGGVNAEQRVAAGEAFDLVFLAADALRRLAETGHVFVGSVTPLVLSQVAVAVPDDANEAAAPPEGVAFADANEVRAALRAARKIGYSTGPSGTALVRAIEEWDMSDEIGKRLIQARPGVPVARSLAAGEIDLGFQQLSELIGQPRIRVLGVLPPDCAIVTLFSGAVTTASPNQAEGFRVLAQFASPDTARTKRAHGFEPLPDVDGHVGQRPALRLP